MNIGKFWRNLTRVATIETVGSKPPYVHHPSKDAPIELTEMEKLDVNFRRGFHQLCDQLSGNRNFLETINEMNQANWHHAINALNEMKLTINSFDSIIRNVDERMGKAEILLGIQKAELVYKKKIIKTIKPKPKKSKKP